MFTFTFIIRYLWVLFKKMRLNLITWQTSLKISVSMCQYMIPQFSAEIQGSIFNIDDSKLVKVLLFGDQLTVACAEYNIRVNYCLDRMAYEK